MKNLTTNFKFAFLILISLFTLGISSCSVEGCTDPNAENYDADASSDDGTCIFARDKFIGNYSVNENCSNGNFTYSITVSQSTTASDAIIVNNFGSWGVNVKAIVAGDNITFNDTQSGLTFSGSGSISGNTLTIIYTVSQGAQTISCTKTCIKQ